MAYHPEQTQFTNQMEMDSDSESDESDVDYLLELSNQLWTQMLDYEKVVTQLLNLGKIYVYYLLLTTS